MLHTSLETTLEEATLTDPCHARELALRLAASAGVSRDVIDRLRGERAPASWGVVAWLRRALDEAERGRAAA
jgi:hypothetical protein